MWQDDQIWREEQFHKIMQTVLRVHSNTLQEVNALNAVRFSTREELYRRIQIAHDFIRSFYDQPITLQKIAEVSCLSPNHLLRNYSQIFGKTPHHFISELRITKAKKLLGMEQYSITDISFEIGLNNPVSFSKLFKQYTEISPLQFRKGLLPHAITPKK
jgi:AraC family transcriptional regulator